MKRKKFFKLLEEAGACEHGVKWAKKKDGGPKKIFMNAFDSKKSFYHATWLLEVANQDPCNFAPCDDCTRSEAMFACEGNKHCRKYTKRLLPPWKDILEGLKKYVAQ